jgi:formylglycine-generating enzyme required for sulfatase activity
MTVTSGVEDTCNNAVTATEVILYVLNGTMTTCDGGYLDPETDLCWQDPPLSAPLINWYEATGVAHLTHNPDGATNYCEDGTWGGKNNWRVPDVSESISLIRGCVNQVDTGDLSPSICGVNDPECLEDSCNDGPGCAICSDLGGPGSGGCYWDPLLEGSCGSFYWSSSTLADDTDRAWRVSYWSGYVNDADEKSSDRRVRCVRDPMCTDPVPGNPTVTSSLDVTISVGATSDTYILDFSEKVFNVTTSNVIWTANSGTGTMDSITADSATSYTVMLSGLANGDSYTITVTSAVEDTCNNAVTATEIVFSSDSTMAACAGGFLDPSTSLCWQDPPSTEVWNWYEATGTAHAAYNPDGDIDPCGQGTWGGKTDWRVPDINELKSLIRGCANGSPTSDLSASTCRVNDPTCLGSDCDEYTDCNGCSISGGPGTEGYYLDPIMAGSFDGYYWSTTSLSDYPNVGWHVNYESGGVHSNGKASNVTEHVRCVRDFLTWMPVPGGTFQMGLVSTWTNEAPVHEVVLQDFQMTRSEVTVSQYSACVTAGECTEPDTTGSCDPSVRGNWGASGHENDPVNCVDWTQASTFCQWMGARLPSESQWEYAARNNGQTTTFTWGEGGADCTLAVMNEGGDGCGTGRTDSVCTKEPGNTSHGLCNMPGNVSEWTQDNYHGSYDCDANPGDYHCSGGGVAPDDGSAWEDLTSENVVRGGSFTASASSGSYAFRTYLRSGTQSTNESASVGFRCARSEICDDSIDNDDNGLTDWMDPGCPTNIAFVTAASFTGDMDGLATANSECQDAADFVGLPENTYVAWLSTSTVDAIDQVDGARGWVRVDGKPFGDTIDDILSGKVYHPLNVTEYGSTVNSRVFTGTYRDGTAQSGASCSDWEATSDNGYIGYSYGTYYVWGSVGVGPCAESYPIYCFGIDHSTRVTPLSVSGRIAFISTTPYIPNTGLAEGNSICRTEASNAGLPGTYKALLAVDGSSAISRFDSSEIWVRPDGTPIVENADDLHNGLDLLAPINVTADGDYVIDVTWTGAEQVDATTTNGNCTDWSTDVGSSYSGHAALVTSDFFNYSTLNCSTTDRTIYCLQE